VKIQLASDLHLEQLKNADDFQLRETIADVIVLAGDIHEGVAGLEWAAQQMDRLKKPLVYVAGNHEFWGHDLYELREELRSRAAALGVHYIDNDSVEVAGTRFIGGTLWTDYCNERLPYLALAYDTMMDFRHVRARAWREEPDNAFKMHRLFGTDKDQENPPRLLWSGDSGDRLVPMTLLDEHKKTLTFFDQELSKPFPGQTVVVTHHSPSLKAYRELPYSGPAPEDLDELGLRYAKSAYPDVKVAAYVSDLSDFLAKHESSIDLWCHGHLHDPVDTVHRCVRIKSSPRGYPGFVKNLDDTSEVIDLDEGLVPYAKKLIHSAKEDWQVIIDEVEELIAHDHQDDPLSKDLVWYRLQTLMAEFNELTLMFSQRVHDSFDLPRPGDSRKITDIMTTHPFQRDSTLRFGLQSLGSPYYATRDDEVAASMASSLEECLDHVLEQAQKIIEDISDLLPRLVRELHPVLPRRPSEALAINKYMLLKEFKSHPDCRFAGSVASNTDKPGEDLDILTGEGTSGFLLWTKIEHRMKCKLHLHETSDLRSVGSIPVLEYLESLPDDNALFEVIDTRSKEKRWI
jgi:predicted phosphodiesterase